MKTCLNCQTCFVPKTGTKGLFCSLKCTGVYNGAKRSKRLEETYYNSPRLCKCCNCPIPYKTSKNNIFCSHSCAGIFNNKNKDYSQFTPGPKKGAVFKKHKPKKIKINDLWKEYIAGPFTKVYLCKCKITGKQWYSPTAKTIHPSATGTRKLYAYQCRFKFSIRNYPDYFEHVTSLIKELGWYSASNRGNNLNGCSRDHMYSISDGFANNVDPKIISHPANCRIIPHKKNQSKNKKSVITLNELLQRIEQFDAGIGDWNRTNL